MSAFDDAAHGAAFLQRDAQGVGSCGQLRDVELVGVHKGVDQSAGVVEDLHFGHPFGIYGEFARGGVGVDDNAFEIVYIGNAYVVDGQVQDDDAVAALLGLTFVGIFAALGQHLAVPFV